jgi:hypothetical protein
MWELHSECKHALENERAFIWVFNLFDDLERAFDRADVSPSSQFVLPRGDVCLESDRGGVSFRRRINGRGMYDRLSYRRHFCNLGGVEATKHDWMGGCGRFWNRAACPIWAAGELLGVAVVLWFYNLEVLSAIATWQIDLMPLGKPQVVEYDQLGVPDWGCGGDGGEAWVKVVWLSAASENLKQVFENDLDRFEAVPGPDELEILLEGLAAKA